MGSLLEFRQVVLDPSQDGCVSDRNASIRHHESLKLSLKLVYQLTQRMMIWLSKWRPTNSASSETNRRILP
jgi:hypothetical protein